MPLPLSNGEIHFLWWFIQGSIMAPSTRSRLWHAWGMCERHSWAFLSVEAALRQGYLHGPTILYEDLMNRARALLAASAVQHPRWIVKALKEKAPCLMCAEGYGPASSGAARPEIVRQAQDPGELIAFAAETSPFWRQSVCGRCAGEDSVFTCRRHLLEDLAVGNRSGLPSARKEVEAITRHLKAYGLSFRHGYHGTATEEDKAALIRAVGWCSGWKPLLFFVD